MPQKALTLSRKVEECKPLATGRADYFGALPNQAARVMGQAHGGQALIDQTVRPWLIMLATSCVSNAN
jgi:hypothetical protein